MDEFAPRLSFFWNGHNNFFEEIAKYRAARRIWAHLMKDEIGAKDPKSWAMRFHTQTAGSTLTAQQPLNNVVRTTTQALAAILGGTQSLHTNSYDEALGLPTDESALLALRTQQIIAYESGVADTVDPLAGSYFVESLTDELETAAAALIDEVEKLGGSVAAIEEGWMSAQIEESAYREAQRQSAGSSVMVGMNRFESGAGEEPPVLTIDPGLEEGQRTALRNWKMSRNSDSVESSLQALEDQASSDDNLMYPIRDALLVGASVGEVSERLRRVFGRYRPRLMTHD